MAAAGARKRQWVDAKAAKEYECTLCSKTLVNPTLTVNPVKPQGDEPGKKPCGHLFCAVRKKQNHNHSHVSLQACINNWLDAKKEKRCPICSQSLTKRQLVQDAHVERIVSELRVKCDDCDWEGRQGVDAAAYDAHREICGGVSVTCPVGGPECRVRRSELASHVCPFEVLSCRIAPLECTALFSRKNEEEHLCPFERIVCLHCPHRCKVFVCVCFWI
jgi:hypothetical protein